MTAQVSLITQQFWHPPDLSSGNAHGGGGLQRGRLLHQLLLAVDGTQ